MIEFIEDLPLKLCLYEMVIKMLFVFSLVGKNVILLINQRNCTIQLSQHHVNHLFQRVYEKSIGWK
jgi:hypothetical protein